MSAQSCHTNMETLETLYCPPPVSRPTNETSQREAGRDASVSLHSPSLSLSLNHTLATLRRRRRKHISKHSCLSHRCAHTHTHTHTHTALTDKQVHRCHKLPIISKNKTSVYNPEPVRLETHQPIGEGLMLCSDSCSQ